MTKNCKNVSKKLKPTINIAPSLSDKENDKFNFVMFFPSKMRVTRSPGHQP